MSHDDLQGPKAVISEWAVSRARPQLPDTWIGEKSHAERTDRPARYNAGTVKASSHDVTMLLQAWRGGDEEALHALVPLVHDELRRIARRSVRRDRANHSIQATLLVNEAFMRLVEVRRIDWRNRAHFLAMAARVMRRVLVDLARARRADKRGGGAILVSFDEEEMGVTRDADVVRLDDALEELATLDARKGRVVELRFFAGLTVDETAATLGVSSKTVLRDWEFARAWLRREVSREAAGDA